MLKEESINSNISNYEKIVKDGKDWIKAIVPGDVHIDLINSGKISEPTVGLNSFDSEWIENRSWWYKKTFKTEADWVEADVVELEINGLDVSADIFLNGNHIGKNISAFKPFLMDIKNLLKDVERENLLVVRLTTGLESFNEEEIGGRKPFVATESVDNRGDIRRIFIRKPQYSYGWDWSPRVTTCGITGDVLVRPLKTAVIRNVYIISKLKDGKAHIELELNLELLDWLGTCEGYVNVEFSDKNGGIFKVNKDVFLRSGYNFIKLAFDISNPYLWWPNGMGDQHLYRVNISTIVGSNKVSYPVFDYGIRTVEMDIDKIDKNNRIFAVIINGKRVYCRGANWIPADVVYGRISCERYKYLIEEAKEANFTMLRVWGGGLYEKNCFYEYCDKYGIMIWQDFMFACAEYPDDKEWFVEEVEKEIKYQIIRLRNHACITLWCGNNENHWAFLDWWGKNTKGGIKLYNKVIPAILNKYCPNIPYWNSSPYGGKNPNSTEIGDTHHWFNSFMNRSMEKRINPREYDKVDPKFISEYGYIGPCIKESTIEYLGNNCIDRTSRVWEHHANTHEKDTVIAGIKKHYKDTKDIDNEEYLYYGGLCQGAMLEYSLDSFRSNENCYGALFWMYNDCWGEVGWSIIDYYLRRKISYNFVRRANYPIRLIIRKRDEHYLFKLANDTSSILNDTLEFGYASFDETKKYIKTVKILAKQFSRITCSTIVDNNINLNTGYLFARLKNTIKVVPAIYRVISFQKLKLPNPGLAISGFNKVKDDSYSFIVQAKKFAHAVHFNLPSNYLLSDEYFDLLPGEKREIIVAGKRLTKNMIKPKSMIV